MTTLIPSTPDHIRTWAVRPTYSAEIAKGWHRRGEMCDEIAALLERGATLRFGYEGIAEDGDPRGSIHSGAPFAPESDGSTHLGPLGFWIEMPGGDGGLLVRRVDPSRIDMMMRSFTSTRIANASARSGRTHSPRMRADLGALVDMRMWHMALFKLAEYTMDIQGTRGIDTHVIAGALADAFARDYLTHMVPLGIWPVVEGKPFAPAISVRGIASHHHAFTPAREAV